jgi:hypothetical protein
VIPEELIRTAVIQLAGSIHPDLSSDPPPAQAEGIILTQISAGLRVDDAIEKRKEI